MKYAPRWAMGIPRSKAHPAKVCFARLIFADHVVAASILFNSYLAFRTFLKKHTWCHIPNYLQQSRLRRQFVVLLKVVVTLCAHAHLGVGCYPVWSFWIIITLLDPLSQEAALDWIVPVFTTRKAKSMVALARNWPAFDVQDFDSIVAVWRGTPPQEPVALKKYLFCNANNLLKAEFLPQQNCW